MALYNDHEQAHLAIALYNDGVDPNWKNPEKRVECWDDLPPDYRIIINEVHDAYKHLGGTDLSRESFCFCCVLYKRGLGVFL